jgi:NADH:ubiquinone reductase (H+-translocating)
MGNRIEIGLEASPREGHGPERLQVVISGARFAGLHTAKALSSIPVDVPVIARRNYHLLQPLLCQVATAGLPSVEIAMPIRAIPRKQRDATVLLCRPTGIDRQNSLVEVGEQLVSYDILIVATGARRVYFGHDEWERVAPGLKKIADATDIRRNILFAFERAETVAEPQERRRPLNFVITGGGPTGVELAGAIVELARKALAADFRNIDPHQSQVTQVTLIEANPHLLAAFPETLSTPAKDEFEHLAVEVRPGMATTVCDEHSVVIAGEGIEAAIICAASVAASPAAKWLGAEKDRVGRGVGGGSDARVVALG